MRRERGGGWEADDPAQHMRGRRTARGAVRARGIGVEVGGRGGSMPYLLQTDGGRVH